MSKYPLFAEALRKLAPTNRERAERLGVSMRSVAYYLRGNFLPPAELIKQIPALDEALTQDMQADSKPEEAPLAA